MTMQLHNPCISQKGPYQTKVHSDIPELDYPRTKQDFP